MHTDELVESIFASLQWDCWRFHIPTAKPLLKQDIAVVSHGHLDHWHPNFHQKDLVLVPWQLQVPKSYENLRNVLAVDESQRLGELHLTPIGRSILSRLLSYPAKPPHAFWWLVATRGVKVLFVGDLSIQDIVLLRRVVLMSEKSALLSGILIPSFGGVLNHGVNKPMELSRSVKELINWLRETYNVKVGALPHPVAAEWADYNAAKLQ